MRSNNNNNTSPISLADTCESSDDDEENDYSYGDDTSSSNDWNSIVEEMEERIVAQQQIDAMFGTKTTITLPAITTSADTSKVLHLDIYNNIGQNSSNWNNDCDSRHDHDDQRDDVVGGGGIDLFPQQQRDIVANFATTGNVVCDSPITSPLIENEDEPVSGGVNIARTLCKCFYCEQILPFPPSIWMMKQQQPTTTTTTRRLQPPICPQCEEEIFLFVCDYPKCRRTANALYGSGQEGNYSFQPCYEHQPCKLCGRKGKVEVDCSSRSSKRMEFLMEDDDEEEDVICYNHEWARVLRGAVYRKAKSMNVLKYRIGLSWTNAVSFHHNTSISSLTEEQQKQLSLRQRVKLLYKKPKSSIAPLHSTEQPTSEYDALRMDPTEWELVRPLIVDELQQQERNNPNTDISSSTITIPWCQAQLQFFEEMWLQSNDVALSIGLVPNITGTKRMTKITTTDQTSTRAIGNESSTANVGHNGPEQTNVRVPVRRFREGHASMMEEHVGTAVWPTASGVTITPSTSQTLNQEKSAMEPGWGYSYGSRTQYTSGWDHSPKCPDENYTVTWWYKDDDDDDDDVENNDGNQKAQPLDLAWNSAQTTQQDLKHLIRKDPREMYRLDSNRGLTYIEFLLWSARVGGLGGQPYNSKYVVIAGNGTASSLLQQPTTTTPTKTTITRSSSFTFSLGTFSNSNDNHDDVGNVTTIGDDIVRTNSIVSNSSFHDQEASTVQAAASFASIWVSSSSFSAPSAAHGTIGSSDSACSDGQYSNIDNGSSATGTSTKTSTPLSQVSPSTSSSSSTAYPIAYVPMDYCGRPKLWHKQERSNFQHWTWMDDNGPITSQRYSRSSPRRRTRRKLPLQGPSKFTEQSKRNMQVCCYCLQPPKASASVAIKRSKEEDSLVAVLNDSHGKDVLQLLQSNSESNSEDDDRNGTINNNFVVCECEDAIYCSKECQEQHCPIHSMERKLWHASAKRICLNCGIESTVQNNPTHVCCSKCRNCYFCSADCQDECWKDHQKDCFAELGPKTLKRFKLLVTEH